MPGKSLEEILLAQKKVHPQILRLIQTTQRHSSQKLGEILLARGLITEEDLGKALAESIGWPYYEATITTIQKEYLEKADISLWREYATLPIILNKDEKAVYEEAVLFADPFNEAAFYFISSTLKLGRLLKFVSTKSKILQALLRFARPGDYEARRIEDIIARFPSPEAVEGYEGRGQEISINMADLIDSLVVIASSREASDIHIEPTHFSSDIRLRIDGVLQPLVSMQKIYHPYLVNAIYGRAGIDPQSFFGTHDAQLSHEIGNQKIDIRLSSLPTREGATLCLRLLNRQKMALPFSELGYNPENYNRILEMCSHPRGLFLFTGPVGSGKTTTLAALLSLFKKGNIKILTIEDPIEIELPMAQQLQINPEAGVTFASATMAFLRHDPNILLIGEIRDDITMKEAFRATLTGCKTFSTLHAFTCYDAFARLRDLGLSLSYLAQGLGGIVSQRLVRKLCPKCKTKREISERYPFLPSNLTEAYFPVGCPYCYDGYRGRTVLAEVLEVTPQLKKEMLKNDLTSIREAIKKMKEKGEFHTLLEDATHLIKEGITSIEEVKRIVGAQDEV